MLRPDGTLKLAKGLLDGLVRDTRTLSAAVAGLEDLLRGGDTWGDHEQARYQAHYEHVRELVSRYRTGDSILRQRQPHTQENK